MDKESVLRNLGIGHLAVNLTSKLASQVMTAQVRQPDRYSSTMNKQQVVRRLALPLVFEELLGIPLRYMEANKGLWVAKDMVNTIQFNAGCRIDQDFYVGINIEYINDLRHIYRHIDKSRLQLILQNLSQEFSVVLGIDQSVTDKRISTPINMPARDIDVQELMDTINAEANKRITGKRTNKPHLSISRNIVEWNRCNTKNDYINCMSAALEPLQPLMTELQSLFASV